MCDLPDDLHALAEGAVVKEPEPARHLPTLPGLAVLSESICEKVVCRMRQLPVLEVSLKDEDSSEDEELVFTQNH